MEEFGNRLKRDGVGLFYLSGHGVQIRGVDYLLPIGVKVRKEAIKMAPNDISLCIVAKG